MDVEERKLTELHEADTLVMELFSCNKMIAEHEKEIAKLREKKKDTEWRLMDLLEDAGLESFKSNYGTFSFRYQESVKMPQELDNKKQLFDYLKQTGDYDQMITVHSQRLNSWYKAQLEEWQDRKAEGAEFKIPGLDEPKVYRKAYLRTS